MLVISRSINSAIRINENVQVRVLKLGQRRVTLGVEAPSSVTVRRSEVSETKPSSEQPGPGRDLRVLVVEDTPVHALLMERVLAHTGITNVVRTSTGGDALRLVQMMQANKTARADLILLDLELPGVPGIEILNAVKSHPRTRSIPVVVVSGSDDDAQVNRCLEEGANAFLPKSPDYGVFRDSLVRTARFWAVSRLSR